MEGQYIAGKGRVGEPITLAAAGLAWLTSPSGQATVSNFVNGLIGSVFGGGGPSRWANAGAGVHDWFTNYGDQGCLDWMAANHPDSFGSLDSVKAMRQMWLFSGLGWAVGGKHMIGITQDPYKLSSVALSQEFWATLGVNFTASLERAVQTGWPDLNRLTPPQIVLIPGFNGTVAQEIRNTIDAIGNGDALTEDEVNIAGGLADEEDQENEKSRNTLITVVGAGVTLMSMMK